MRYADLSRHVWILWSEARYGHEVDPAYRKWIVERTHDRICDAALADDTAPDELGKHLVWDYRLVDQEKMRFNFWWAHVLNNGFDADNPLAGLHKKKVVTA